MKGGGVSDGGEKEGMKAGMKIGELGSRAN